MGPIVLLPDTDSDTYTQRSQESDRQTTEVCTYGYDHVVTKDARAALCKYNAIKPYKGY